MVATRQPGAHSGAGETPSCAAADRAAPVRSARSAAGAAIRSGAAWRLRSDWFPHRIARARRHAYREHHTGTRSQEVSVMRSASAEKAATELGGDQSADQTADQGSWRRRLT